MLKKFLIGTLALAIMFGGVALQKVSAAPQAIVTAADIQYAATVKLGSSGQAALIWQNFLNGYSTTANLVADGKFGKLSTVQAKAWQGSRGLVADGVLGAMSRASAMAQITSGTPASAFPAGCTSTAGYSSVTGASCATVSTLPAGCTSSTGYSSTTGASCAGSVSLPAGCSTSAGYSTTTGASCSGSVVVNNGPLTGGAGSITLSSTSTDVESTVNEGASNTKVLGFKVEATDSDVSVTNLKVSLKNVGTYSTRLDRYVGTVSVYMNGTKVGSADVADFTKDNITYTKSIALTNAVVRQGSNSKATFYITISANSSIDSLDMTNANWAILVNNIRFQDATGVVMTDGTNIGSISAGKFTFSTLATSGDVKVTVSKGSSNPLAANFKVSDTSSTKDVLMLEFKVKATGGAVTFDTLNITPTSGGSTMGSIVGELQLKNGSNVLATIDGSDLTSGASNAFNLDDTFKIAADTTETFQVYATINDWDNFKTAGGNLKVSFASFSPEDVNGDTIGDTGSAIGEQQTFVLNAPVYALVSKSLALSQAIDGVSGGQEDVFLAKYVFNVTAGDDDVYLPKATSVSSGAASSTAFATYTHTGAGAVNSIVVTADNSSLDDGQTNTYLIAAGSTEKFTLSFYVRANDTSDKFTINSFNYGVIKTTTPIYAADSATFTTAVSSGLSAFETDSVYLAK